MKTRQEQNPKTMPWFIAFWLIFWLSLFINVVIYASFAYLNGWNTMINSLNYRNQLEFTVLESQAPFTANALQWLSHFFPNEFKDLSEPLSNSTNLKIWSIRASNQTLSQKLKILKRNLTQGFNFLKQVFFLCVIKFINIFAPIWLYAMTMTLGVLDGLTARYIRTVEGGRESTFIFHHLSKTWVRLLLLLLLVDTCSPLWTLPNNIMALIVATFLFFYSRTRCAHLKKFL